MPGASIAADAPDLRFSGQPRIFSMSPAGRPPGLSSQAPSPVIFTIVEFDADRSGPAVQDQPDPVAEIGCDVRGGRRAHPARHVGRGSRQRSAEGGDQIPGEAGRHPQPHGFQPGRRQRMDRASRRQRQDERQRPRPEFFRQPPRRVVQDRELLGHGDGGHVADQRVEPGTALDLVNAGDGLRVGGVGGQAVHRLGRHGDRHAAGELVASARERGPGVVADREDIRHVPFRGEGRPVSSPGRRRQWRRGAGPRHAGRDAAGEGAGPHRERSR